jgi:uncharacterized membrane protein HdeD (DUF308 family)
MDHLKMQRLATERDRTLGIAFVVLGSLGAVVAAILLVLDPTLWLWWASLIIQLAFIVVGLVALRRAARSRAEFEELRGKDAGRQTSPRERP